MALLLIFIAGIMISPANFSNELNDNKFNEIKIVRTLKYDYIVSNNNKNYLLKSHYNFFEGDLLYGKFSISEFRNKNSYTDYLKSKNVFYQLNIIKLDSVVKGKGIEHIRMLLISRTKKIFNYKTAGFLNSILWGYKKDIDSNLKKGFVRTGAIHFIAISGLHTGILYILLLYLFYFLPIRKKYKLIIVSLILMFYAYLTYLNPPVLRAVIFILFINISLIYGLEMKWDNIIILSAIFFLLFNPYYIYDNGFILSFISVFVIGKVVNETNKNFIMKIFLISFFISLYIAPFLIYKFNYISVFSPIVSVFLMPIFFIILPLSFITIIFNLSFMSIVIEKLYLLIKYLILFFGRCPVYFEIKIDVILFILLTLYILLVHSRKYRFALICAFIILLNIINY